MSSDNRDEFYQRNEIGSEIESHSMWAGKLTPSVIPNMLGYDGKSLELIKSPHTGAALTCINEILANAIDHAKKEGSYVNKIIVTISKDNISVYNNGTGIPAIIHKDGSAALKRTVYVPELIFSDPLCGSSNNERKNGKSIKAGVNSLGAKICNIHSKHFMIETADHISKVFYTQEFDTYKNPKEPKIIKDESLTVSKTFTRVTFKLNFDRLYTGHNVDSIIYDLIKWLRYRTMIAAAYVGAHIQVIFNGEPVTTTNSAKLAEIAFPDCYYFSELIKSKHEISCDYPWDITVAVVHKKVKIASHSKNLCIVNGVVSPYGKHVEQISKSIKDAIVKLVVSCYGNSIEEDEKYKSILETYLKRYRIVMMTSIPGADWSDQTKTSLASDGPEVTTFIPSQKFVTAVAEKLWIEYTNKVDDKKPNITAISKYREAEYSRAYPHLCTLAIVEGDSAGEMISAGLSCNSRTKIDPKTCKTIKDTIPNTYYYGSISLQGVIPNIYSKFITVDGTEIRNFSIEDNERLNNLRFAIGLNYDLKYETAAELKTLNYGRLLICTDEDLDGVGKIASLLLVYLYRCWPALVRGGFVYRLKTPLIRVNTGKEIIDFYTTQLYEKWNTERHSPVKSVAYYKGLASHRAGEIKKMFGRTKFEECTYKMIIENSAKCQELFNAYFGKHSELRKILLSEPVNYFPIEREIDYARRREISIEDEHLDIATREYKKDATERQLIHVFDGLTKGRRKLVYTAQKLEKTPKKVLVLSVFGATAVVETKYHHGEASIINTAVYLAQSHINSRFYPLLYSIGIFGDRHGGKPGSARYIKIRYSCILKYLYRSEDEDFLINSIEDGDEVEPTHFMPVVPLHILEDSSAVSEGWSNSIYGRDFDDVINIIKIYLEEYDKKTYYVLTLRQMAEMLRAQAMHTRRDNEAFKSVCNTISLYSSKYKLGPNLCNFEGHIRGNYSVGRYKTIGDFVCITELPLGVTTDQYLTMMFGDIDVNNVHNMEDIEKQKRKLGKNNNFKANSSQIRRSIEYIFRCVDRREPTKVFIEFQLYPGAIARIKENYGNEYFDPIEDFFCIIHSINSNINLYSPFDTILEFGDNYLAAMLYWIDYRREMYEARIMRAAIINKYKIEMNKNILRFIRTHYGDEKLKACEDDDVGDVLLQEWGYARFNSSALNRPGKCYGDALIEKISGSEANYEYLYELRTRNIFKSATEKLEKKLSELITEEEEIKLQLAERPIGKSVWIKELEDFKYGLASFKKEKDDEYFEDSA
jgi:DNA topoisomerase-2